MSRQSVLCVDYEKIFLISGVLFSKLYLRCREEFLASSELTLKGHLTEFCDHQLARSKRGTDGQESLFIPMGHESVKLLLSELDVNSTEIWLCSSPCAKMRYCITMNEFHSHVLYAVCSVLSLVFKTMITKCIWHDFTLSLSSINLGCTTNLFQCVSCVRMG